MAGDEQPRTGVQPFTQRFLERQTRAATVADGRETAFEDLVRQVGLAEERRVGVLVHRVL